MNPGGLWLSVPLQNWVEDCCAAIAFGEGRGAARAAELRRASAGALYARGEPEVAAEPGILTARVPLDGGGMAAAALRADPVAPEAFARAEAVAAAAGLLAPGVGGAARTMAWRDCLGMVGAALLPTPGEALTIEPRGPDPGLAAALAVQAAAASFQRGPEVLLRWRGYPQPGRRRAGARGFFEAGDWSVSGPVDGMASRSRVPEAVLFEIGPSRIPVGDRDLEAALAPLYRVVAGYFDEDPS